MGVVFLSRTLRLLKVLSEEPEYLENHGFHVGPTLDLGNAFKPLQDEGGGSLASSFANFETGPSESSFIAVLSSDVLGDRGDGEHGIKAISVDCGDFINGAVCGRFIRAIDDHGPFFTREAWKSAQGNQTLLVVLGVFDPLRKGRELPYFLVHAGATHNHLSLGDVMFLPCEVRWFHVDFRVCPFCPSDLSALGVVDAWDTACFRDHTL